MEVPLALLEGFAEVWTRLAGGRWQTQASPVGTLVFWTSPDGRREALPERMYGLAQAQKAEVHAEDFPTGLAVNLPPGVRARDATLHAVGHQLVAANREDAWHSLRRVGRQGVLKARRMGCVPTEVSAAAHHELASLKAARYGSPAPHPELVNALRATFGGDAVLLQGVLVDDIPIATVLALQVDGYGVLVDGTSDRAHWDKNPNNLAVWSAVGWLVDRGCARIDYGFSAPGAGDLRFKDHMGGREVPLYRLCT